MPNSVLVVDDDGLSRELLESVLEANGYEVSCAASGRQAIDMLHARPYDVILSDVQMQGGIDGIRLLDLVKEAGFRSAIVLFSGFGDIDKVTYAIREGAFDFLSKPFDLKEVIRTVKRATEPLSDEAPRPCVPDVSKALIGRSPGMIQVYRLLARASLSRSNVLVLGESGTGKELIAREIHKNSARCTKPFVSVNCGSLPETLLESELFGHARGAFTGAIASKKGLFEEANGGTLFLDEIGDITPAFQVKLLRVLQEGELRPVGGSEVRTVDVRVIAATHRDLEDLVAKGAFREDLYYRIKVLTITLPALRERTDDIEALADYFLARFARQSAKHVTEISREAMALLKRYSWPGNVRELENAVEHALAMCSTGRIHPEDFPEVLRDDGHNAAETIHAAPTLEGARERMEKEHIIRTLERAGFNKCRAAEMMGIDRATLYRKAQRYGIPLAAKRPEA